MPKKEKTEDTVYEIDTPSYRGPDRRKRKRANGTDKPTSWALVGENEKSIWAVAYEDPLIVARAELDED